MLSCSNSFIIKVIYNKVWYPFHIILVLIAEPENNLNCINYYESAIVCVTGIIMLTKEAFLSFIVDWNRVTRLSRNWNVIITIVNRMRIHFLFIQLLLTMIYYYYFFVLFCRRTTYLKWHCQGKYMGYHCWPPSTEKVVSCLYECCHRNGTSMAYVCQKMNIPYLYTCLGSVTEGAWQPMHQRDRHETSFLQWLISNGTSIILSWHVSFRVNVLKYI